MTLVRAAAIVVIAVVVFHYVLLPIRLPGISMLPTYREGAINFTNRLSFWRHGPTRGDIVAIRMAGKSVMYITRIIGLPGERVEIVMGVVKINGEPLLEPMIVSLAPRNLTVFTLGDNDYFVVGDNRGMAIENHDLGRAKRDRIVGRMLF